MQMTTVWLEQYMGHWQWDQDLTLMHDLTLWSLFSMERYLVQPRHGERGVGPASMS